MAQPSSTEVDRLRAELAEARRKIAALEAADRAHQSLARDLDPRTHELGERIKELDCLYGLSHLVERPGVSLDEILQGTAHLLPPAWQYPEIACARVVLDDREFMTANYIAGTLDRQTAELVVHGRPSGLIEVCYREVRPESDEGPFLAEERSLLNAIAARLGRIIERKRMEEAIARSEQQFRTLFETMAQGVVYQAADGQITSANPAAERILGLTLDQMQGRTSMDPRWRAIHPDGSKFGGETHPAMVALRTGREVHNVVMGVYNPHIEAYSWIQVNATPQFRPGEAEPYRVYTTFEDITERIRTERALRESEERFRIVSELASDWAYATRLDAGRAIRVEWVTDAFTRIVGFRAGEYGGFEEWLDSIHPEDRPVFERRMATLLAGQEDVSEYRVRDREGRWRWVRDYGRPEWDAEQGRVLRIYGAIQDISARVEAERALREAHDELEERVRARTQELEQGRQRESVLNALLRLSMQHVSLDQHLEQALDEILSIPWLPVLRQGAIMLADENRVLHMRVQRGLGAPAQKACAHVQPGQCLCGRAALSGEIEFSDHVDERHEIVYAGLTPHGQYCVPLVASRTLHASGVSEQRGASVLGVLVLYLGEGHRRGPEEIEFLQAIGHTLAGTIERVQAEEALRELNNQLQEYSRTLERRVIDRTREIELRRRVAASLRDILAVLNSDRPLDEVLEHIVAHASRLLGSDVNVVYRLDEEDETLSAQTVLGRSFDWAQQAATPAHVRQALHAGEPIAVSLLPDGATAERTGRLDCLDQEPELEGDEGACKALLSVPLVIADETYGALALFYASSRAFTADEVDLAVAFADQAALAIENARLQQRVAEAAIVQERARLARELHDSVTQSLYSLTLLAEGWRRLRAAGRLQEGDDPLAEVGRISQQALKEMRLLVYELRPLLLEEEGLLGALHQRLGAVEQRAGVEARLLAQELIELPAPVQECLYGIATEALNNALKHASASRVTVHLSSEEVLAVLEVADDGVGFEPERGAASAGMGLQTMRERAAEAGGTLSISSAPGEGTRVVAKVPRGGHTHE